MLYICGRDVMDVVFLFCFEAWSVLYVSLGSKVRPRTFGYVAMFSAVLFIGACVCRCDGYVICIYHDLNRCSECW